MRHESEPPPGLAERFRFRLQDVVGEGASGVVWRAVDARTGKPVAVKVPHDRAGMDAIAHEAEALLLAASPFVPSVIDVGVVPDGVEPISGKAYVALGWVTGTRLAPADLQPEQRPVVANAIARDVGAALDDLHQAGMAHGDIKPSNILISWEGETCRAMLVDLGYATSLSSEELRGATPRYCPPELAAGTRRPAAHDLWALGICLAEVASPFVAADDDPATRLWSSVVPAPFGIWARALTASQPSARPPALWLRAAAQSEQRIDELQLGIRRVRSSYLRIRRDELVAIRQSRFARAGPDTAPWLAEAIEIVRRVHSLRAGADHAGFDALLGPLDAVGRKRWLVALAGVTAAAWPMPPAVVEAPEDHVASALERLASRVVPAQWTLHDVVRAVENDLPERSRHEQLGDDEVELALALVRRPAEPFVLSLAEQLQRRGALPMRHELLLADGLRSIGQLGRAHVVLERRSDAPAVATRSEVLRRMGKLAESVRQASGVGRSGEPVDPRVAERACCTWARALYDQGDVAAALRVLGSLTLPEASEVRALCLLARGQAEAALEAVEVGLAVAVNDEVRARLSCVRGMEAHARGHAKQAYACFLLAAEDASRAGAVIEEATYQTGVAAAAVDAGRPSAALDASLRASLLWEHLEQPGKMAYSLLARAAAFALVGDVSDAGKEAERARGYALTAGDRRATAYIAMLQCDIEPRESDAARLAAELAFEALGPEPLSDDALRVAARRLRVGVLTEQEIRTFDQQADAERVARTGRAEWWAERARAWLRGHRVGRDADVVSRLMGLVREPLPLGVKGPAVDAARALAARGGDGEATRLLASMQVKLSLELMEDLPPWLREYAVSVPWMLEAYDASDAGVSAEQVRNLESLVRSLAGRESLRRLLEQALDALVLWTGVERGVLLLRAPNERLVVRAARNLERQDLRGEQLHLSQSLARRALSTREPVVAVDAAGEVADVHHSVHALGLRSVLAVPLISRGESLGVAYLDDRVRKGAFGPQELSWVRLVAGLAAMAITDARSQLMLRREARRAKRAEARVKEELARREAELALAEKELARGQGRPRKGFETIVGESAPVRAMLSLVERVAASSLPVLVEGESGSGKELVARALHDHSDRAGRAFVTENCSAIPEPLFESTLFGHVRGAFTGADRRRVGLFESADGGSLFLDEVGEIPLRLQSKLLRVLQDGEIHPLGSPHSKRVDVRVIAATNRDLRELVAAGTFREDLLYRLNVIAIQVPSLRERIEDIPVLVQHFLTKHDQRRGVTVSRGAWAKLESFGWPGNVRQLENEIRRAIVLCEGVIRREDLSAQVQGLGSVPAVSVEGTNLRARVGALEKTLVTEVLARTGGNQTRAAKILGVSRYGLQKMIKRMGL